MSRQYSQEDMDRMRKEVEDTTSFRVSLKMSQERMQDDMQEIKDIVSSITSECVCRQSQCAEAIEQKIETVKATFKKRYYVVAGICFACVLIVSFDIDVKKQVVPWVVKKLVRL